MTSLSLFTFNFLLSLGVGPHAYAFNYVSVHYAM